VLLAVVGPLTGRPTNKLLRGVLTTGLTGLALAVLIPWAGTMFVVLIGASLADMNAGADEALRVVPAEVLALPGVQAVRDARLQPADLATGHNLTLTAEVDPALSNAAAIEVLGGVSTVLTQHRHDVAALVVMQAGRATIGVSANPSLNDARLAIARQILADSAVGSVTVTLVTPGDDLIVDEGRAMSVVVYPLPEGRDQATHAALAAARAHAPPGTVATPVATRAPSPVEISVSQAPPPA